MDEKNIFNNLTVLILFIVVSFVSGILAGVIYYDLNVIEGVLQTVDFNIPIEVNHTNTYANLTTFQDILGIVIYPILGLKTSLPYLVYFMIFAMIIALGMLSYMTAKNPIFFILHLLYTLVMTYFCIILSNNYSDLLENVFINAMMQPFAIYNKLMIYLPQVFFFTSLVFALISFIMVIKPKSNAYGNQSSLNYGGDYWWIKDI